MRETGLKVPLKRVAELPPMANAGDSACRTPPRMPTSSGSAAMGDGVPSIGPATHAPSQLPSHRKHSKQLRNGLFAIMRVYANIRPEGPRNRSVATFAPVSPLTAGVRPPSAHKHLDVLANGEHTAGVALIFSRDAVRALLAMPKRDAERLREKLEAVATAPAERHPGVEAMQGRPPGRFRVRQGDWRAVFRIDGGDVLVDRVGHRGEVYR